MIYELRSYTPVKGRELELIERFRSSTLAILARRHFIVRDYWLSEQTSEIIYVVVWESVERMNEEWARFRDDAEWMRVKASTEANGPIVEKISSNILVRPAYFNPAEGGAS
jgi:heme-degrading monooxygenase HmoA